MLTSLICAGVQVSLEDAEVLLGTAERTNIAGQDNSVPFKVSPTSVQLTACHCLQTMPTNTNHGISPRWP